MSTVDQETFASEQTLRNQEKIYENEEFRKFHGKYEGSSSLLWEIIRNLSFGSDVTQVAAPIFTVAPYSLLEHLCDFSTPDKLLEINSLTSPLDRMVNVMEWVLEGYVMYIPLYGFYNYKPYNPIKGEQFHCKWSHQNSVTEFHSEQVVHHPPISASYFENKEKRIMYEATTLSSFKYWGNSAEMLMNGNYLFHALDHSEIYSISYPKISVRGIIWGSPTIERQGIQTVRCSKSGYSCKVEYFKGMDVFGEIFHDSNISKPLVTIKGNLKDTVTFTYSDSNKKPSTISKSRSKRSMKTLEPIDKQQQNESRRVWHNVTNAIYKRDLPSASKFKTMVEDHQRRLRAVGKEGPETPVLFDKTNEIIDNVPIYKYKYYKFKDFPQKKINDNENVISKEINNENKSGIIEGDINGNNEEK